MNLLPMVRLVESARMDLSNEKRLQTDLAELLDKAKVTFVRECVLSERDVPDFFLKDGLVIECKLRPAQKMAVYRQLERYALHTRVTGIILASNLSMTLPPLIQGKPATMASLSQGWL